MRPVIRNVQVSPDGSRLALLKIPSRDGDPVLEIYDAADLTKEPFRMAADPMEITGVNWVTDTKALITLRQKVRDKIDGFNQGVYEFRLAVLDAESKEMRSFEVESGGIVNLLPSKPDKVIIAVAGEQDAGTRGRPRFRPFAYYEFDLNRGSKKLILRGKRSIAQVDFDGDGNPWIARGFDIDSSEFVWYRRKPSGDGWSAVHRQHEDDFDSFSVMGFDVDNPTEWYVIAENGENTAGLWSFDIDSGEMTAIYRRSDVDVFGVLYHSNGWEQPDRVAGLSYFTDMRYREYLDETEAATYAQLEEMLPNAHHVRITSRSRDGATLTIQNVGPRDPQTHYLLKGGHLRTIGSSQPLFRSDDLADVEYIKYKSRDGLTIPAYLTVPNKGEPPYPLIVMPHGGPFVPELVSYNKWAQLIANQGYLVLQPQYRGSRNYGLDFYLAAFKEGGQGGYTMQDDKDDGALHLVKEGLADKDRIAMLGWSYGGYAALVAASRTPQIYQCVVAGAAVSDANMQVNYYRFRLRGAPREEQLRFWDDSVSPIDEEEVKKVNVPMLIIHGDVDQRVPIDHAKKYLKLLDEHDKEYEYLELKGADHFSNTLFYDHQLAFYTAATEYLAEDCGPGGL